MVLIMYRLPRTSRHETVQQPGKNLFTQQDIDELKAQPFIEDVAPLVANQFRIQLSAGEAYYLLKRNFLSKASRMIL